MRRLALGVLVAPLVWFIAWVVTWVTMSGALELFCRLTGCATVRTPR